MAWQWYVCGRSVAGRSLWRRRQRRVAVGGWRASSHALLTSHRPNSLRSEGPRRVWASAASATSRAVPLGALESCRLEENDEATRTVPAPGAAAAGQAPPPRCRRCRLLPHSGGPHPAGAFLYLEQLPPLQQFVIVRCRRLPSFRMRVLHSRARTVALHWPSQPRAPCSQRV